MIQVHPEIIQGQSDGQAVVALESTIITHGMPYPQNLETAQQVEADIRAQGALPATIAVLKGKLHVGLNSTELEQLATTPNCLKLSRADLALALSSERTGSTTVAATMIAAQLSKITFFATGGIGGVHRGVQHSLDISADLTELARTPVTVICAGAKAILDVPRTLEYLETAGVPVIAYRSDSIPAFWSRSSAIKAPIRLDTVAEIIAFLAARRELQLAGGVLVANPIPIENEINADVIEGYIDTALRAADTQRIKGKDVTPFLLAQINQLSGGQSLASNIALVRHNAKLAANLAAKAITALA